MTAVTLDSFPPLDVTSEIEAPWGSYKIATALQFIEQCRDQLRYFLTEGQSPNEEFTRDELAAYEEVLETKNARIANAFLSMKAIAREGGRSITSRQAVGYLQSRGLWEGL